MDEWVQCNVKVGKIPEMNESCIRSTHWYLENQRKLHTVIQGLLDSIPTFIFFPLSFYVLSFNIICMSSYACNCTNVVCMFCVYCIYYYVNKFEARSLFSTSHFKEYLNYIFFLDGGVNLQTYALVYSAQNKIWRSISFIKLLSDSQGSYVVMKKP